MKTKEERKQIKENKKAVRKFIKDKIKEEVKGSWRNYEEVVEWGFMKAYEIYRAWSSVVLLLFFIYFMIVGNYIIGFVFGGFIHLHLLYNQIWHRLKQIQFFYQNSLYINNEVEKNDN